MKPAPYASESQRYAYPLTSLSTVVDVGAYHGAWSAEIAGRYHCRVYAFEPCRRFFELARMRLLPYERVTIHNSALGAKTGELELHVQNDSTGAFATSSDVEHVHVLNITKALDCVGIMTGEGCVDLIKLNCEGAEFEIFEALLTEPQAIRRYRHIQVQFHTCVPDAELRHAKIYAELTRTHEHTYGENPFIWQGFSLRA